MSDKKKGLNDKLSITSQLLKPAINISRTLLHLAGYACKGEQITAANFRYQFFMRVSFLIYFFHTVLTRLVTTFFTNAAVCYRTPLVEMSAPLCSASKQVNRPHSAGMRIKSARPVHILSRS